MHLPHNTKNIEHFYKSKFNLIREHQVILLMIKDVQKSHYTAVKKLNALSKKKTDHSGNYFLNYFNLLRVKSRFEIHKKECQN